MIAHAALTPILPPQNAGHLSDRFVSNPETCQRNGPASP